jgi:sulfonate transport system ATP-binding protein
MPTIAYVAQDSCLPGERKTYLHDGQDLKAIEDVTFDVPPGRFVVLLGPSGCGKSTFLNIVAGFDRLSGGMLLVDGRPISGPGSERGVVLPQHCASARR